MEKQDLLIPYLLAIIPKEPAGPGTWRAAGVAWQISLDTAVLPGMCGSQSVRWPWGTEEQRQNLGLAAGTGMSQEQAVQEQGDAFTGASGKA